MRYRDLLDSEFEKFRLDPPSDQLRLLAIYAEEVDRWNRKINLTALSAQAMVRRLIVEPIWIGRELGIQDSMIDVGSGNGSPAIPIAIGCALQSCHLVESRSKRAVFLRHLRLTLGLKNTEVHRGRFEVVAPTLAPVQWVTLQAIAMNNVIVDAVRNVVTPTTTIVWITSTRAESALTPFRTVTVPITGTRVFLYRLDLS